MTSSCESWGRGAPRVRERTGTVYARVMCENFVPLSGDQSDRYYFIIYVFEFDLPNLCRRSPSRNRYRRETVQSKRQLRGHLPCRSQTLRGDGRPEKQRRDDTTEKYSGDKWQCYCCNRAITIFWETVEIWLLLLLWRWANLLVGLLVLLVATGADCSHFWVRFICQSDNYLYIILHWVVLSRHFLLRRCVFPASNKQGIPSVSS